MEQRVSPWPRIRTAGFDGLVVSFADHLTEPANRAALAFSDALKATGLAGVEESSTSLVSAYVRFDPLNVGHAEMRVALERMLAERDWMAADLPTGRQLWHVPTAFGGAAGPQLAEASAAAGFGEADAIASISGQRVRVQTIGFAPGMPYLGELSPAWNIPRQTSLTARVPAGGLCVAIRQLVLFPVATPTGWRHIGQTALRLFRPDEETPFLLRAGDEVQFDPVPADALRELAEEPNGGAAWEPLP
ncbi:MAG: allophanate hydrolase subunit 1 [Pseudomonadota bacterium]